VSWVQANRKVAIVVALTVAVPLILVLYFVVSLWMLGHSDQGKIDSLEPRIARLIGVKQAEVQLLASSQEVESRIHNLVYPATENPDTVSAALQKNVRGIMSGAGLVVADSRIESTRREGAFDVIGLTVSVSGGIDALNAALLEVVSYAPLLLVSDINVMLARSSKGGAAGKEEQIVDVKIHLLALRGVE
jgi:general secretion pathway protein M